MISLAGHRLQCVSNGAGGIEGDGDDGDFGG
jgi:hypothetical protein